ncbi:MAG TPA: response regulator [Kofleriaceae bacterium]|jgi:CheY-like chemotaxis protein|nr:response regulator [Kofleriaceae bacterium]
MKGDEQRAIAAGCDGYLSKPPIVMLVEDNAITRASMRRCLEGAGFSVIEAPDGKTALEQAIVSCPALIAQDMQLPDIDGFELLEALRKLPMYPDHGGALDPLVEAADAALYRAKDAGRNRIGIGESARGTA